MAVKKQVRRVPGMFPSASAWTKVYAGALVTLSLAGTAALAQQSSGDRNDSLISSPNSSPSSASNAKTIDKTNNMTTSSGSPSTPATTGSSSIRSNPSGSGTSTSGGKDDNGDQGADNTMGTPKP